MATATSNRRQKSDGLLPIVGPVLTSLITPITAEGAAIIAFDEADGTPAVLYATRERPSGMLDVPALLSAGAVAPSHGVCPDDVPVLAGPWQIPSGPRMALVFWREKDAKPWKQRDHALVLTAAAALTAMVTHSTPSPKDTTRHNVLDRLTGLPKARKFVAELPRHFARLDKDRMPGTLLVVNVDGFELLITRLGRKIGEAVLQETAALLVRVTRPSDLIARLEDNEFAIWLGGADHFAAAERAEQLRVDGPAVLATAVGSALPPVNLSVGIATRQPGSMETPGSLMRRADYALHEAKAVGPWSWRVSQEEVG